MVDYGVKYFALFKAIAGGIDRSEKFYENFARMDDQRTLFHDAVSSGTGHRNDGNCRFDGHDDGTFLEFLQSPVMAASAFRVDQERLPLLHGFDGFF